MSNIGATGGRPKTQSALPFGRDFEGERSGQAPFSVFFVYYIMDTRCFQHLFKNMWLTGF